MQACPPALMLLYHYVFFIIEVTRLHCHITIMLISFLVFPNFFRYPHLIKIGQPFLIPLKQSSFLLFHILRYKTNTIIRFLMKQDMRKDYSPPPPPVITLRILTANIKPISIQKTRKIHTGSQPSDIHKAIITNVTAHSGIQEPYLLFTIIDIGIRTSNIAIVEHINLAENRSMFKPSAIP